MLNNVDPEYVGDDENNEERISDGYTDYCVFESILDDDILDDILSCFDVYPEEVAQTHAMAEVENNLDPDIGDLDPDTLSPEDRALFEEELEEFRRYQREAIAESDHLLYDYRKCKRHLIHTLQEGWLRDLIDRFAREANLKWMFNITDIDQMELLNYAEPMDGYKWHSDSDLLSESLRNRCRKLTIIIQLSDSDDYEGCDLEIINMNKGDGPEKIENVRQGLRQKGTVIIFPSFLKHRITPLIKGNRKSLVAWMTGEPWK